MPLAYLERCSDEIFAVFVRVEEAAVLADSVATSAWPRIVA
jgi:hypothetical protein